MNSHRVSIPQKFDKCNVHPQRDRAYFDSVNKKIYCDKCITEQSVNISTLKKSDEYCLDALSHWKKLRSWAQYLECEHDQKVKEYGISWRTAFKAEIAHAVEELKQRVYHESVENMHNESLFKIILTVIQHYYEEVLEHSSHCRADMVLFLQENFRCIENHVAFLKKILKEPEISKFKAHKNSVFIR